MQNEFLVVIAVAGAALLIRLFVGRLNHNRIREYIAGQGGTVLGITWRPFGNGWFGEKDSVIYDVRYRDREGNVHSATCKTGMFSGVYFTNDHIITRAPRTATRQEAPEQRLGSTASAREKTSAASAGMMDADALAFENRRLREENRQLRAEIDRLRLEWQK